jgi:hypothetical protein
VLAVVFANSDSDFDEYSDSSDSGREDEDPDLSTDEIMELDPDDQQPESGLLVEYENREGWQKLDEEELLFNTFYRDFTPETNVGMTKLLWNL